MTLEYQCICGACPSCLDAIRRHEESVILAPQMRNMTKEERATLEATLGNPTRQHTPKCGYDEWDEAECHCPPAPLLSEPRAELKEALAGIRLKWPPVRGLRESVVEDSPLSDRLEGLIETLTHTAKATLAAPSVYTESDFTAARAALVALFLSLQAKAEGK